MWAGAASRLPGAGRPPDPLRPAQAPRAALSPPVPAAAGSRGDCGGKLVRGSAARDHRGRGRPATSAAGCVVARHRHLDVGRPTDRREAVAVVGLLGEPVDAVDRRQLAGPAAAPPGSRPRSAATIGGPPQAAVWSDTGSVPSRGWPARRCSVPAGGGRPAARRGRPGRRPHRRDAAARGRCRHDHAGRRIAGAVTAAGRTRQARRRSSSSRAGQLPVHRRRAAE